jgi:hypothetical protein
MTDIMIDLETLSTRADAAILSVGIAVFDIKTAIVSDVLYKEVAMVTQEEYGHIDPETVKWWMKRDDAARSAIYQPADPESLYEVLYAVRDFLRPHNYRTTRVWSNGSSFDLVILRNAFQRHTMKCIWDYWQERDVRTIVDLARDLAGVDVKQTTRKDHIEHHALGDALFQVAYVSEAYRVLSERSRKP